MRSERNCGFEETDVIDVLVNHGTKEIHSCHKFSRQTVQKTPVYLFRILIQLLNYSNTRIKLLLLLNYYTCIADHLNLIG